MKWLKHAEERFSFIHAIESVLASVGSYFACYYVAQLYSFPLSAVSGLWGSISAFMVLGAIKADVLKSARDRIFATSIAAIISLACIYLIGYESLGLAVAVFLSVVVLALIKRKDIYRSTCITVAVIFVVGTAVEPQISPWLDCVTRFLESLIGVGIACLTVYIFHPIRHRIG
jgi:uncharacterized membrane protein YgaE (UPF0421/DUF939 family)